MADDQEDLPGKAEKQAERLLGKLSHLQLDLELNHSTITHEEFEALRTALQGSIDSVRRTLQAMAKAADPRGLHQDGNLP